MRRRRNIASGQTLTLTFSLVAVLIFSCVQAFELMRQGASLEVWSIYFAFVAFLVSERLAAIGHARYNEDKDDEMRELLLGKIDLTDVGFTDDGMHHIIKAMKSNAVCIHDVAVRTSPNVTYLNSQIFPEYVKALGDFLKGGRRYVLVGNDQGLTSFECKEYFSQENYVRRTADVRFPIVNLLIIEYDDGTKEVLFGWDFDNIHVSHVFKSRSPLIVSHFEGIFDTAYHHSKERAVGITAQVTSSPGANGEVRRDVVLAN